ncbi:MAG TPA: hypothetical protein VN642_04190 [Dongiaceae bacterium]|nr:hypothetical protein [Dongiaceae bacterium]
MAAKKIGRDHKTIIAFSKQPATVEDEREMKEDLADAYEGLARRMIASITDSDISKINAYQRTIAASAATDKMHLVNGKHRYIHGDGTTRGAVRGGYTPVMSAAVPCFMTKSLPY